ncbi:MAG: protein-methionine-sulfoxide reductase heme-binding subunit MsrQ [Rhodobacteraceae bacterium]|nr:protein-methionine-sulfoxide reductase heme-binding subunit MsrQ [Paracoccaceae bacterium]
MMKKAINRLTRHVPTWPIYALAPLPVIWIYYEGITGGLGVDPAKKIEHQLGLWSLWILIAGLAITPLREHLGVNLLKYRRAIGVTAFFYVMAHMLTWLVLDVQFQNVWADIVKRPYITVGMAAFAIMTPLALTSNNWSLRKMGGAAWRKLHKATYAVLILGALHWLLLVKGFQWEPIIYSVVIAVLLLARMKWRPATSGLKA